MPAVFFIDTRIKMVFSKATGVLGLSDVLDHMDRLKRDPDFRPDFNQLVDFRELANVTLTHAQIRELARRPIYSKVSRRSFVVAREVDYGLSRMFAAYREIGGEPGIRVFRDMRPSLDWISLREEPDPKLFPLLID